MDLLFKAGLGAGMVVLIALLSRTRSFYIAGLVPLFPTFSLIAHFIVGTERGTAALKGTILFGAASMGPYLLYLASLYWLIDRLPLYQALMGATLCWLAAAGLLIYAWGRFTP